MAARATPQLCTHALWGNGAAIRAVSWHLEEASGREIKKLRTLRPSPS